jgi:hypothetical protein
VTLCFGLGLATLLVLLVIPALILLLEGVRTLTARLAGRPGPPADDRQPALSRGASS